MVSSKKLFPQFSAFILFFTKNAYSNNMKTYFLSAVPCALTVNQTFFGVTDLFERFAEIHLADNVFIEFKPQNAQPVAFFLNENIRFQAPEGVEVYFVQDGLLLYAKDFAPSDCTLRPIAQSQADNAVVTVFQQGKIQVNLQTGAGFFNATLPPSFTQCKIAFIDELILLSSPTALHIFNRAGKRVFAEDVSTFHVKNGVLSATLPLLDSLGRYAHVEYALSGGECTRTAFSLSQARTQDGGCEPSAVQAELIAFAFFETVLFGGDYAQFLSENLRKKAEDLRGFLGEFIAVTPTANPYVCGLVQPIGERIYETAYFTVQVENGLICDVQG